MGRAVVQWFCPDQKTPLAVSSHPRTLKLTLFSVIVPNPLRKKGYFDQLWIFLLTKIHCTEKLRWWSLRAVLIYGDGDGDLEDCWVLYSLIKITIENSVLRLMSFQTMVGQKYSSGHEYCNCRVGLSTLSPCRKYWLLPYSCLCWTHWPILSGELLWQFIHLIAERDCWCLFPHQLSQPLLVLWTPTRGKLLGHY